LYSESEDADPLDGVLEIFDDVQVEYRSILTNKTNQYVNSSALRLGMDMGYRG